MISVLILTRNEQLDLPAALASVAWSDDVHVLDSCSTDATVEIARAAGASVHTRVFDDYASQRNAGLRLPFKHEWVFLLDADERATPELAVEMQQVVRNLARNADGCDPNLQVSGFRLRRRDFLFGTWLRHAQISPFYIRLVRPSRTSYSRAINEVLHVAGDAGLCVKDLQHAVDHYPFNKGFAHWVSKHNLYSTMEAELIYREQGLQNPSLRTALTEKDFHLRRRHQKALFYRLPARHVVKWAYMMFFRGALLDGGAGVIYATLQSFYEYLIVVKTEELRRAGQRVEQRTDAPAAPVQVVHAIAEPTSSHRR
ncbi:Glycosyltransferase involved in cell wall bisynthesis [Granulicella rosea]|uniref:Glycosyltransferase involved in cell wall bisynthesis n=1 Tax=Granulicella rosea TaxID=474952 RepID=A0A239KWF5_9BACT|nr:glycosyltransferase family 2 protein [Granulicella rosea]SNT21584.1 Glycosyltransferase involved in cell wall bisynthesis [Granulicella rosea]